MGTESRSGHGRGRRRPVSITAVGAFVVALLLGGATVLAATPAHAAALPANAGRFVAVAPSRVYDSRAGAGVEKLGPDGTVRVVVTGRAGVPATGVVAVAVNLTATDVEGEGFLSVRC